MWRAYIGEARCDNYIGTARGKCADAGEALLLAVERQMIDELVRGDERHKCRRGDTAGN